MVAAVGPGLYRIGPSVDADDRLNGTSLEATLTFNVKVRAGST